MDIRADLKAVNNKIKENVCLNTQRKKNKKYSFDDIKYKIKGYSIKKDKNNNENEIYEKKGRKIIFNDNEEKKFMEHKDEEQIEEKKEEDGQNFLKEIKIEIMESIIEKNGQDEKEKEEKINGKKRMRRKQKKIEINNENIQNEIELKKNQKKLIKAIKKEEKEDEEKSIQSKEKDKYISDIENKEENDENNNGEEKKVFYGRNYKRKKINEKTIKKTNEKIKKEIEDTENNNIKTYKKYKMNIKEGHLEPEEKQIIQNTPKKERKKSKNPISEECELDENSKGGKNEIKEKESGLKSTNRKGKTLSNNKKEDLQSPYKKEEMKKEKEIQLPKLRGRKKSEVNKNKKKEIIKVEEPKKRQSSRKKGIEIKKEKEKKPKIKDKKEKNSKLNKNKKISKVNVIKQKVDEEEEEEKEEEEKEETEEEEEEKEKEEEEIKVLPIRNLSKQLKGILKNIIIKADLNSEKTLSKNNIRIQSKSKFKEIIIDLSEDEPKNRRNRTISERLLSPPKLKINNLEYKIIPISEKKPSFKKREMIKKDTIQKIITLLGKKRNISFENENNLREYSPRSPVKEMKKNQSKNRSNKKRKK